MKRGLFWALLIGSGLAVAQVGQTLYELIINGQKSASKVLVVNGESYIPLKALKAAGVTVSLSGKTMSLVLPAPGGANQRAAVEGCINEQLFNGIWRLKVLSFEKASVDSRVFWRVNAQLSNGLKKTIPIDETGFDVYGSGLHLALANGTTLTANQQVFDYLGNNEVAPGATVKFVAEFQLPDDNVNELQKYKPTKFLADIDAKELKEWSATKDLAYTVADPSIRVKLDCKK